MPICVAGMHRSGTSMVAKYLRACGLDLGPDAALMPAAPENPEGFYEHVDVVETNEEILNQLGGGWDCPPPEPADWTAGRLAPLVPRAEAVLAAFAGREPWGWKDPRTSLTLPFWKAVVPALRVVVVVRNPLEVALSLRRRNGFSYALGLTLWEITNRRVLAATEPGERVVTHYNAYFDDPRPEVGRLLASLAMPDHSLTGMASNTASDLRHHHVSIRDLMEADVSDRILDLYGTLCGEAGWHEAGADRPKATRRRPASRVVPDLAPAAIETGVGHLSRSAVELRRLEREVEEYRLVVENRDARIADLELGLRRHESAQSEREAHVAAVEAERARLERELEQTARDRRQAIEDRERIEREAAALRQTVGDQADHLAALGVRLDTVTAREAELRSLLGSAHEQLLHRDAEIVATLGSALHPHAPGAPAAIYYRQLLEKIRAMVDANLPPTAPILVVSGGDDAMLAFGDRPARHFPPADGDEGGDYRSVDDRTARAQLERLAAQGAEFLILPAPGRAWLARHPGLARHLDESYPVVVRDETTAVVYALNGGTGTVP